jgi:hypothetical protein
MIKLFRQRLFEAESKLKKNTAKKASDSVGGVPRAWLDKSTVCLVSLVSAWGGPASVA